jgi:hypothetical protein
MDTPEQELSAVPPPDAFDAWCDARERREMSSVSARYVPREMVGYEDLDANGVWSEVPPYGMVWRPRAVAVGWAPYHNGHWAWVEPWGWTWIDDAPWGFAPFHYGRWAFAGGAWVWVPGHMAVGAVAVRPVYAPALVAFVGGPGFGVAVGAGGVGMAAWFPLGPGEVYRPAYHVSEVYVRNINIVHVSNVTVIDRVGVTNVRYVNQGVVGAVTVVPHDAFVSARPVAVVAVRVPPAAVMHAEVVGTVGFAPRRESVLGTTTVVVHAPPERIVTREVVARTPPPPRPVPFAAKERALQANGGRPLAPEQLNSIRASAPARAPMVRSATAVRSPSVPAPRPAGAPGSERPQAYRPPANDRPPSARPAPAVNNGSRPPQTQSPRPAAGESRPQTEGARPPANEKGQERRNDRPAKRNPKKGESTEKKG